MKNSRTALIYSLFILTFMVPMQNQAQVREKTGKPVPLSFCISDEDQRLYLLINEYRGRYGLAPVALSKSLSYVARLHARDLMYNQPDQGNCNFHSWSDKGPWTPFCYPRDESKKMSVWDKPRELTRYPAKAFEIVYWENTRLDADSVMDVWKSEDYFNSFLLNTGKWLGQQWNALGVAIEDNYACAWFGTVADPDGIPELCSQRRDTPVLTDSAGHTRQPAGGSTLQTAPSPPAPAVKSPSTADKPAQKPADQVAGSGDDGWYVIVRTGLSAASSNKIIADLRASGYPDATLLDPDTKMRISAYGPADKASATRKLKELKAVYKDAWLHRVTPSGVR